jgi:hypothetical protein
VRAALVRAHDQWVSARFAELSAAQLEQLASLLRALRTGLRADPEAAAAAAVDTLRGESGAVSNGKPQAPQEALSVLASSG